MLIANGKLLSDKQYAIGLNMNNYYNLSAIINL